MSSVVVTANLEEKASSTSRTRRHTPRPLRVAIVQFRELDDVIAEEAFEHKFVKIFSNLSRGGDV